jgi:hypothetical protein
MLTLLTNEKFSDAYALIMRCVEKKIKVDVVTLTSEDDTLYMALLSMLEYISINYLSNPDYSAGVTGMGQAADTM